MTNLSVLLLLLVQAQSTTVARDWDSVRGIAEAEYEILMMLIKQEQWGAVPAKARQLFSLPFPIDQQHLKVAAARESVDQLIHANRPQLAHAVLDAAIENVNLPRLQADLYREKGFVCEKEGRKDCAMECFEKSIALERQGLP